MALPQHLQHYRGLIDLIAAALVCQIEVERRAEAETEAEVQPLPAESRYATVRLRGSIRERRLFGVA
jgi:hypothetical protein